MARKLKTYVTSSGFFDLAVAAPSMKAALETWGSKRNLFQQGFAKETDDAAIIKTTMAHPGIVLRRPVGTKGDFKERADLPKFAALQSGIIGKRPEPSAKKKEKKEHRKIDPAADRKAAQLFDLAQKRRVREEWRAEAQRGKRREQRTKAIQKAEAALDDARARHEKRAADIAKERDALDRRALNENERWNNEKGRLDDALRRARE